MADLLAWLTDLSLERHYEAMKNGGVDLSLVPELTEEDLRELGFGIGDRKRFMVGQRRLTAAAEAPTPERPAAPPMEEDAEFQERRQLSLMFVDLVGSTALSHRLDLEAYRETLHIYQKCCLDAIRERHGFVAQFLGDGVVAYFGYPVADEAAAEAAVLAGLAICEIIPETPSPANERLDVRVGVSTGDVLMASLTAGGGRLAFGDTPNLAARLQSSAAPGTVAISDATRQLLGRNFTTRSLGKHRFKGFAEEVEAWTVTDVEDTALRFASRRGEAQSPMINREDELITLDRRWAAARRYEGQVVCLSGEAGIGKSRLIAEMIGEIGDDAHVIGLQCSPYRDSSAFYPVILFITLSAKMRRSDSDAVKYEKLATLMAEWAPEVEEAPPVLAALLGLSVPAARSAAGADGTAARERLQDLLIDILLGFARRRPLMILFEDLHWIDPSSEELIQRFIERLPDKRIMLLCTYRTGYDCRWAGMARVTTLPLTRLDENHSKAMVRSLFDGPLKAMPRDVEAQIIARTDGVPLFLEEMVRMVGRRLSTPGAEGEETGALSLPSSLRDLLRAQIDSLPSARDVIPVCAAIGRVVHPMLLSVVSGVKPETTLTLLEQLVEAKMLVRHGSGRHGPYSFRHVLILDVAYEAILPSRARALHKRIADELTGAFTDLAEASPEILAHHYEKAEMPREARDAWRDAAMLATSRWATKETLSHLRAALACNERAGDEAADTAEIELRKMMVVALHHRGFAGPAHTENYTRLSALLRKTGGDYDASLPFITVHNQFGAHLMKGEAAEADALCADIDAVAAMSEDRTLKMLSAHDRGMAKFFLGDFAAAKDAYAEALRLRAAVDPADIFRIYPGDLRLVDGGMRLWARCLSETGEDLAAARRDLDAFADGLAAEQHLFSRCYALAVSATAYQALGDEDRTRAFAERGLEISAETEFDYWSAWCRFLVGWARAMQGDTAAGAAEIRSGVADYLESGSAQMRLYADTLLADVYRAAGEVEEGLKVVQGVRRAERRMSVRFQISFTDRVEAALRAASDRR